MRCALLLFVLVSAVAVLADTFTLQPDTSTIQTPGNIIMNLNASNTQPIYGLELTVEDEPERAVFSHIEITSRTTGAIVTSATQGNDIVKVALILSGTGNGIAPGNGSILKIHYSATGSGKVNFDPSNLKVYSKNGTAIGGSSIDDTEVTLQPGSTSRSSSSSGSSGGGGSGSSGKSSGKSSSTASTSANTQLPFQFTESKPSKENLAPTLPPEVIETTANAEIAPIPQQIPEPGKTFWPWIIGALVSLAGGALLVYAYKKQSKI